MATGKTNSSEERAIKTTYLGVWAHDPRQGNNTKKIDLTDYPVPKNKFLTEENFIIAPTKQRYVHDSTEFKGGTQNSDITCSFDNETKILTVTGLFVGRTDRSTTMYGGITEFKVFYRDI